MIEFIRELFCPEHGIMVLVDVIRRYWYMWFVAMRVHRQKGYSISRWL